MAKLIVPLGRFQRSMSCCRARAGVACVAAVLAASCATGVRIDEDVQIAPYPAVDNEGEPFVEEGGASAEPSGDDADGMEGGEPAAGEMSEGSSGEEVAPAEPRDEEPEENDSEPIFPDIVPIADVEPESDGDDSAPGAGPSTEPEPTPDVSPDDTDPPAPDPLEPPPASDSVLDPAPAVDPVDVAVPDTLPAPAHCLADWEGHSCDMCSGQTQSDLVACRMYIDCYIVNDCDPASCGSVEQVCGVNQLGNGLAPKEVADAVYGCMCVL